MIYELVRRDPAWKIAPFLALCAAAAGALGGMEVALFSLPMLYFFAFNIAWPHQRAIPFQAALPIAGRTIFAARAAALLAMVWMQIAAGSAAALVVHGPLPPAQTPAAPAFGLFFTFVVLYVLTVRVEQCGGFLWLACPALGISLVALPFILAKPELAAGFAAVGAVGSFARFLWAWRRIPAGFQSAPYAAVAEKHHRTAIRPFGRRLVPKAMFSGWYVPFCVLGLLMGLLSSQPLSLACLFLPAYSLTRRGLRWLPGAGLPYTSRRLLAMIYLPLLAAVLVTYIPLAYLQHRVDVERVPEISSEPYRDTAVVYREVPQPPGDHSSLNVTVPFEYWRIALGHAPEIRAPWGESVEAYELDFAGLAFYNPYTVGRQNTKGFQQWQFARAKKAAYGRGASIPIPARIPARILEFALLLGFTALLAWMMELGDVFPFNRVRRVVFESVFTAALVWTTLIADVTGITHGYGSITQVLFKKVLLAVCTALPPGGVFAVSALAAALPFCLLARRFPKREIVGPVRQ